MDISARIDPTGPFPLPSQLPHDPGMDGQQGFHDSDFDWDALTARLPRRAERPPSEMNRLAWVVLLLLTFCPPLGYVLATLWH